MREIGAISCEGTRTSKNTWEEWKIILIFLNNTLSLQRDISKIYFIKIFVHLQCICNRILVENFNIVTKIWEYLKCIDSGRMNIIMI